jgi:hypothetical protein
MSSASAVVSGEVELPRTKLPVLERPDEFEGVPSVVGTVWVGVVAPEEKAERPVLAGVDGGGRGPNDVSEVAAENGLGASLSLWCLWLS